MNRLYAHDIQEPYAAKIQAWDYNKLKGQVSSHVHTHIVLKMRASLAVGIWPEVDMTEIPRADLDNATQTQ